MLYLASQFVWFLLAAFGLGLAMGWISHAGGKVRLWNGAWTVVAALWAVGAALAWFQWLNGAVATWVETALLFIAAYWAGCVCASLLPRPAAVSAGEAPARRAQPSTIAAQVENPSRAAREVPADALPSVENEADLPGRRPTGQAAARGGKADDLKLIKGVGRQNEGRLHGLGIWHFEQIAVWTPDNIEWVGSYLAFPGRIEREDWVGQAKVLATGADTEFAARAKAGQVETSRDDGSFGQSNVADISSEAKAEPPKP